MIGIFCSSTEGYSYYLWNKTASTVANIHENINKSKHDSAVDIDKHDPFSVLLKGVDERDGDKEPDLYDGESENEND